MANKEAQNCWEHWKCSKDSMKKCPAYQTDSGRECWLVAESFSKNYPKSAKNRNEHEYCWECEWFKKLNPNFGK